MWFFFFCPLVSCDQKGKTDIQIHIWVGMRKDTEILVYYGWIHFCSMDEWVNEWAQLASLKYLLSEKGGKTDDS